MRVIIRCSHLVKVPRVRRLRSHRRGSAAVFTLGRSTQPAGFGRSVLRSEEHTSELQSQSNLVWRLLLEKKRSLAPRLSLLSGLLPPPRPQSSRSLVRSIHILACCPVHRVPAHAQPADRVLSRFHSPCPP